MELNWLNLLRRKTALAHSPQLPKQQKIPAAQQEAGTAGLRARKLCPAWNSKARCFKSDNKCHLE